MDEKGLGHRLQLARQAAGLTQQMLCQKANLSYSTLAKIERGAIKSPSIFTVQNIAKALGNSLDELLGTETSIRSQKPKRQSKSGVKFVYFDVNGCLVRFFHRAFTMLSEKTGQPTDIIESAFWHYNDQVCRGEMDIATFNAALAKQLQVAEIDWAEYYFAAVDPVSGMNELLQWVSENYYVGLLTNIMPGFIEEMQRRALIPLIPYDVIIDSSKVGVIKPEPQVYQIAQEKAQHAGSEILLVDDSRPNLIAAEKFNWRVLWFDDYNSEESIARIKAVLDFDQPSIETAIASPLMPTPTTLLSQIVETPVR